MKMTLGRWADSGWLRPHTSSRQEIGNLLAIVRRDLADARREGLSPDWRFGIAYNAALKLCTILLFAEGFRPDRNMAHYRTLQAMPLILGPARKDDAAYLDACRIKRNTVEYDSVGGVTAGNADELIRFSSVLESEVVAWLKKKHPELIPGRT